MTKQPAVYILASERNGTLYIGVTSDLQKRAWDTRMVGSKASPEDMEFTIWCTTITQRYAVCYHSGEADEEVESGLEAGSHREAQSRLEGLVV